MPISVEELKDIIACAENGDDYAQFDLALCYSEGDGVEQSDEKAAYWYTKSAEQGNSAAQYNLATCYRLHVFSLGRLQF